jgi:hypothetical protein
MNAWLAVKLCSQPPPMPQPPDYEWHVCSLDCLHLHSTSEASLVFNLELSRFPDEARVAGNGSVDGE